jgi:hypothetical protein
MQEYEFGDIITLTNHFKLNGYTDLDKENWNIIKKNTFYDVIIASDAGFVLFHLISEVIRIDEDTIHFRDERELFISTKDFIDEKYWEIETDILHTNESHIFLVKELGLASELPEYFL